MLAFIHPASKLKFLSPNEFLRVRDYVYEYCTTMPLESIDYLYQFFLDVFQHYLTEVAAPRLAVPDGTTFLRNYLRVWDDYVAFVGVL